MLPSIDMPFNYKSLSHKKRTIIIRTTENTIELFIVHFLKKEATF